MSNRLILRDTSNTCSRDTNVCVGGTREEIVSLKSTHEILKNLVTLTLHFVGMAPEMRRLIVINANRFDIDVFIRLTDISFAHSLYIVIFKKISLIYFWQK